MSGDAIFGKWAEKYWAAGLPVIPLRRWNSSAKGAGKAPILNEWSSYGKAMPSRATQESWVLAYPDSNIGLPFGPASGLCAIDIDTEDEDLVGAILDALPQSPWTRIGRKGMGLIYRWSGQSNFKIRDSNNKSIVEFLGMGNQMVMPPSIHPDTGKPYTANVELWTVLDKVPVLPDDVQKVLRAALSDVLGDRGMELAATGRSKPLQIVPEGERDIQMVRQAGYLARVVEGIDKDAEYSLAEAIDQMIVWTTEFTSRVAGDEMDPNKGVGKLLEFLMKDVEKGRTLPDGWDFGLSEELQDHPIVKELKEKNQVARWTYSKARAWFEERSEGVDDDAMLKAVMELVELCAKDDQFTEFEWNTLCGYLMSRIGKGLGMSKPDLKRMFKDTRKEQMHGDIAADHETIAQDVLESMRREGELRHHMGSFWQWNGSCFQKIDWEDIYGRVSRDIKGNVLSRRHADYQAITKCIGILCRAELVEELEIGVNFANGFLDSDLKLHDHNPKYGKTFTLPFNYDPARASECHQWLKFLEDTWGDDEDFDDKVKALQQAFAATMFGIAPDYQRAFLLHGKAGSGKSVTLEVLQALMPPNAQSAISPVQWNGNFALAGMVGKTLNVCGELPEETVIDGAKFKQVVEGSPCTTSFKNQDEFSFRPLCAQWFASNHLPRSRDTSYGFVRRWLIFDFPRVVPVEERIVDFAEHLIYEEQEAIASWAVQGITSLLKDGRYVEPKSHLERLRQIQRANNSVAAWLASNPKVRPVEDQNETADAREAFDHYVFYMKEVSRGFSVTFEKFVQMAEELGHTRSTYRDVHGIERPMLGGMVVLDVGASMATG